MTSQPIGQLLHSFFADHLIAMKGLRPGSIRSYRDTVRLLLHFVAGAKRSKISRLTLDDLTFDRVLQFLQHLEAERGNHIRTRNQRLAALHTLFEYLAGRAPELLAVCQRVAAIPSKRVSPPETRFLERDEVDLLFKLLPSTGPHAFRDRTLLLFLYNTGARVQEVADLRYEDLDLGPHPRVRLHGKGDKWRTCPLWEKTAQSLREARERVNCSTVARAPVFTSHSGRALTRFGIYKMVRRHAELIEGKEPPRRHKRITPHVFRHTTAVHLLEAGVDPNVIRAWLGHAELTTTNRYAEINIRAKEAALRVCEPPTSASEGFPRKPIWRSDHDLLNWLASL